MKTSNHKLLAKYLARYTRCLIIADKTVADQISTAPHPVFYLPGGESIKTLETLGALYTMCQEAKLDRHSVIIAIGGGSITDVGGFAAATYLRGISWITIPTTLLGMVDAAIGGKTGINHNSIKNNIGAFHNPDQVIIDTSFLETLPEREFRSGMAEVIKYGLIIDKKLFQQCNNTTTQQWDNIINQCIAIKQDIVKRDERESGIRTILNFGHTIGHAIEAVTHEYSHGEAVAIGIVGASIISNKVAGLPDSELQLIIETLQKYHLPTRCLGLNIRDLITAMQQDKKIQEGTIQWVLLEKIGSAKHNQHVDDQIVKQVLIKLTH